MAVFLNRGSGGRGGGFEFPAGRGCVRPHPGAIPQERGNISLTHNCLRLMVMGRRPAKAPEDWVHSRTLRADECGTAAGQRPVTALQIGLIIGKYWFSSVARGFRLHFDFDPLPHSAAGCGRAATRDVHFWLSFLCVICLIAGRLIQFYRDRFQKI